jgi:hypothetical protein
VWLIRLSLKPFAQLLTDPCLRLRLLVKTLGSVLKLRLLAETSWISLDTFRPVVHVFLAQTLGSDS